MSFVEVRDFALWAKHVHGNEPLKAKIIDLAAGDLIHLVVDGQRGIWKKMDDGKDGRATPGLKGVGPAQQHWHALQGRRGDLVSIEVAS